MHRIFNAELPAENGTLLYSDKNLAQLIINTVSHCAARQIILNCSQLVMPGDYLSVRGVTM